MFFGVKVEDEELPPSRGWRQVFYQIRRPAAIVTSIYVVTLSLFPGVLTEGKSATLGDWYPVLLIATFNVCDTIGKILSSQHQFVSYEKSSKFTWLAVGVGLRALFIPLYMLCVAPQSSPLIQSEILFFILTIALALTNGSEFLMIHSLPFPSLAFSPDPFSFVVVVRYVGSTAMMMGPELVEQSEKELAGNIMAFCLLFGLACGATIALLFGYLIHLG